MPIGINERKKKKKGQGKKAKMNFKNLIIILSKNNFTPKRNSCILAS